MWAVRTQATAVYPGWCPHQPATIPFSLAVCIFRTPDLGLSQKS